MFTQWFINQFVISYLSQLILNSVVAGYLVSVREKTPPARWLTAIFIAAAFFSGAGVLGAGLLGVSQAYWVHLQTLFISGVLAFALQFIYYFSPSDEPLSHTGLVEARRALGVTVVILTFEAAQLIYSWASLAMTGRPLQPGLSEEIWPALFSLWGLGILLRRARLFTGTPSSVARVARSHLPLTVLVCVTTSVLMLDNYFPWLGDQQMHLALPTFGVLVVFFMLVINYLNNAPETTSFLAKIAGVTLLVMLLLLNGVGILMAANIATAFSSAGLSDPVLVRLAVHQGLWPLVWLMFGASFLAVVGLPLFLYPVLITPLNNLVAGVQAVNNGRLDIQVPVQFKDEIGLITQTFNRMVDSVRHQDQILETQLTERTLALRQANVDLRVAKEKAEIASQAKSEFLSNMSHELRTPLNGILGYAQILSRASDLTSLQRNGLNTIYNSGKHLLALINDVLDLAKIEARRLELRPAEMSLPLFLEEAVNVMRMAAQQRNLRLRYVGNPQLPPAILADEKRLRQVLLNLLGNALKFTERGEVTLDVQILSLTPEAATLRFEVTDTGVGMAPEQLEKIFQPFEQVGRAEHRAAGAGLGLGISQQLVALMGGKIQVKSEVGRGSVFWFEATFPLVTAPSRTPLSAPQKITGYVGARRRVLVVDDRQENRLVLLDLLQPIGFEVLLAENGREGVAVAEREALDIILMDLVMPVMMGFEAVSALRQMPVLARTPIIAVSASAYELDHETSRQVGCDDFLPKPIEADRLFDMLQRYLNLTWVYAPASPPTSVATAELIPPPQEELERLYELARFGNLNRIQERAHDLEALGEQYRPFAQELVRLADDLNDQQMLSLIKRYIQ